MPRPKEEYDADLERLASVLRRGTFTAKQLARELGCAKPTVYERVKALIERGHSVFTVTVAGKHRGPAARQFGLRDV
jgi:predicted ArsR family transcriptional regulator